MLVKVAQFDIIVTTFQFVTVDSEPPVYYI